MMKQTFFICLLFFCFTFSFSQSKDMQAQFLYTKAEDNYAKDLYVESLDLCEQAAEKVGSLNQKILFLELKSYDGLLAKDCNNALLSDHSKIDNLITLYLDSLGKNAESEKILSIMRFRENWNLHTRKGCPHRKIYQAEELGLGVSFVDWIPKNKHMIGGIQVFTSDGLFKSKTDIKDELFVTWMKIIPVVGQENEKSAIEHQWGGFDIAFQVKDWIASTISGLQNQYPDITSVTIHIQGFYPKENQNKVSHNYDVSVPLPAQLIY